MQMLRAALCYMAFPDPGLGLAAGNGYWVKLWVSSAQIKFLHNGPIKCWSQHKLTTVTVLPNY